MTDGFRESVTSWPRVHWEIWALLGDVVVVNDVAAGVSDGGKGLLPGRGSFMIPPVGGCFSAEGR